MVMQRSRSAVGPTKPQLEARHRPSGLNFRFNDRQLTFADYVARSREMLSKAHSALGETELEKIVDGNAPFELKPPAGFPAGAE